MHHNIANTLSSSSHTSFETPTAIPQPWTFPSIADSSLCACHSAAQQAQHECHTCVQTTRHAIQETLQTLSVCQEIEWRGQAAHAFRERITKLVSATSQLENNLATISKLMGV